MFFEPALETPSRSRYTGGMIHIGIDTRITHYHTGGISIYARHLINALESLDTNNHYTIFQSRKAIRRLTSRFKESKLWTPPHHSLERLTLSVELVRHRLDILHSTDFIPPLWGAKRHVINVHDLTFLRYPQHKDSASQRYYNRQIEWAVKRADHVLTISKASKRDIMDMLNVPENKITVHPLGVADNFKPLSSDNLMYWRKKLNLSGNYVLFVSTLEPRKNIPALLTAYVELPKELREQFPLLLVGRPGWLIDDTMKRIEQLPAQSHSITVRSDINDEALPAVYNMAQVLVMPSFYEGFGLTPLEAMACGIPTIVSDISSLPEVVGDVGLRIDPHDPSTLTSALEHALTDSGWRETTRKAGLERAKQFTWEQAARIILSVYRSVL